MQSLIASTREPSTRSPISRVGAVRTVVAICASLLLVVGLAACSSGGDEKTSTGGVSVTHKFGETTVPANPQRVVTIGWNDQDFVLALGTVPVATRAWFDNYNDFPWVKEATGGKGVTTLSGDGIDFESIAKAKPDVIFAIYETIDRKTYDRLTQIAPTVIQSDQYPDEETPWNVELATIGKALGKDAEAKQLTEQVQAKIDAAKKSHPEFAGKVLVENFSSDPAFYLLPKGDPRRALFDALGFGAQETKGEVSNEKVTLLDRDVLFINGQTKQQMATNTAFGRLSVVRDDRTLYAGSDSVLSGALAYSGPHALMYALDKLVPQLGNALTGKPVTDLSNS